MRNIIFLLFTTIVFLPGCHNPNCCQRFQLTGSWQFASADSMHWYTAQVPGNIHSDLLNHGLIPDPYFRNNELAVQWIEEKNWIYRTSFDIPENIFRMPVIRLIFEGLDTYATVILNGDTILVTENMFVAHQVNVKDIVKRDSNGLTVIFESPVTKMLPRLARLPYALPSVNDKKATCPLTRKAPYHYGWDWGPRLVTSGIWRPVVIQGSDLAFIENIQITTDSLSARKAYLTVHAQVNARYGSNVLGMVRAGPNRNVDFSIKKIRLRKDVNHISIPVTIENPKRWYPNGYGEPFLYTIDLELLKGRNRIDHSELRYGIRQVELVQDTDSAGRSFLFRINGVPVFAKGANIIPLDVMLDRVTRQRYVRMLGDVVSCNMNMLRTWGGGIYENDVFYDLCDEMGIMVWQDFMFGNEMYFADTAFMQNVRSEAVYNIRRLRNHPCIVVWCGDNEGEWMWKRGWDKKFDQRVWDDYRKITFQMLPALVAEHDPSRAYWRSSPSSDSDTILPNHPAYGDMHDWSVHFGPPPYEKYLNSKPRFVSEFGHQSFPDRLTLMEFTHDSDRVTGFSAQSAGQKMISEVLNLHNKQPWGNQKILQYMDYYYPVPAGFFDYAYISQLVHADAVKCGVEHYRRIRPHCMGALFWQLNDCWPVISWSAIDYAGRWKALQYAARHFYAPLLISPVIENNTVNIYIISDKRDTTEAEVSLRLMDFKGRELKNVWFPVDIDPLSSKIYHSVRTDSILKSLDPASCFLDCKIISNEKQLSQNQLFFVKAKEQKLLKPLMEVVVTEEKEQIAIALKSRTFIRSVYLFTDSVEGRFSDNYFNVVPGDLYKLSWKSNTRVSRERFIRLFRYITVNSIKSAE